MSTRPMSTRPMSAPAPAPAPASSSPSRGKRRRVDRRTLIGPALLLVSAVLWALGSSARGISQEPPPPPEAHRPLEALPPPPGAPADPARSAVASPSVGGASTLSTVPPLYQLLFEEPSPSSAGELEQALRIRLWCRYMEFSKLQLELLSGLGTRFQERQATLTRDRAEAQGEYDTALTPLLQALDEALRAPGTSEERLEQLAREVHGVQLRHRLEEKLMSAQVQAVRSVMDDAQQLLVTLDPVQKEKLVTSLFFLRGEVDPFATPGTYENLIGPSWNMGDFTALLRQKEPRQGQLDIGGLWGIKTGPDDRFQYNNIKREVIMVFVLKQPALVGALEPLLK